jgi:glycosyltransferase involved in cell wall biosynthesis
VNGQDGGGTGSDAATTISVVIPVYNREVMIGEALESVLAQTVPAGCRMEVIVVDDGSTDGSAARATGYATRDPRVRVYSIAHTGYAGAARNRGADTAAGSIIAFLDSDDLWLPGKLTEQLSVHIAGGTDLSHTRERWVRNGGTVSQSRQRHAREGDIFSDALHKCIIGPSTVMIARDLYRQLGGFREDLEVAEDYEFWLRALCHTGVTYVDRPLTEKRAGVWPQLSEKHGQIEGFRIAALRDLVDGDYFIHNRSRAAQREAQQVLGGKMKIYAQGARKRGRLTEAEQLEQAAEIYRNIRI